MITGTNAAPSWPPIIARHSCLVASFAEAHEQRFALYPTEVICGFLARVEQRFPGMEVTRLRPFEWTDYAAGGRLEWSIAGFLWEAEAAVRAGFIAPEALPQGRKRIYRNDAESGIPLTVTRRRAGWIEARLSVAPTATVHPLSFFSATSVRGLGAARPILRLVVDNTKERP